MLDMKVVPDEGIEPPTFGLQNRCSTAELIRLGLVSRKRIEMETPLGAKRALFSTGAPKGESRVLRPMVRRRLSICLRSRRRSL